MTKINDTIALDKGLSCFRFECQVQKEMIDGNFEEGKELCFLRCLYCEEWLSEEEALKKIERKEVD